MYLRKNDRVRKGDKRCEKVRKSDPKWTQRATRPVNLLPVRFPARIAPPFSRGAHAACPTPRGEAAAAKRETVRSVPHSLVSATEEPDLARRASNRSIYTAADAESRRKNARKSAYFSPQPQPPARPTDGPTSSCKISPLAVVARQSVCCNGDGSLGVNPTRSSSSAGAVGIYSLFNLKACTQRLRTRHLDPRSVVRDSYCSF